MKIVLALALVASASAFVAPQASTASRTATVTEANAKDMDGIQAPFGFWDPFGFAAEADDATLAWYRHAELKHSRVAMAAFVGAVAQGLGSNQGPILLSTSKNLHFGDMPKEPFAAWDAVPLYGKLQIFAFIGFLEFWGEFNLDTHYMKAGGVPGRYPDNFNGLPHGTSPGFNKLWDPLGNVAKMTEEKKTRGRNIELANGRLAMIGIMGLASAATVPGSVPGLTGALAQPAYAGNFWAPFGSDFSFF